MTTETGTRLSAEDLAKLVDELCDRLPSDLPDNDYKTYTVEISVGAIKAMRAALTSHAEAIAKARGEWWKPIDEASIDSTKAPWNGKPVLLWKAATREHYVAAWVRGAHGPGWCTPDGFQIFGATDWQPLPDPPAALPQPQGKTQ